MSTEATTTETASRVGLFPAAYTIGNGMPGGVTFTVHLLVSTPTETVTGFGAITQAVNPPMDIHTKLEGNFTYMTVMPNDTHILVTATGYPIIQWPQQGSIGPVQQPNATLRMVLNKDWQSGTADFSYLQDNAWHKVDNVPVSIIS